MSQAQSNIPALKEVLRQQLFEAYGWPRSEPMHRETFLLKLWNTLGSFVHHHKRNSLIQSANLKLDGNDLIFRMYLILSIRYGSFTYEPDAVSIMKEFVNLLDADLDEEELRACEYARGKMLTFFPELRLVWRRIRDVYGAPEFDLKVLPPTPYIAYVFLVLNRPDFATITNDHQKLFEVLMALNNDTRKLLAPTSPILTIVK